MNKRTLRRSFESLRKDSLDHLPNPNFSPEEGSLFHCLQTESKILKQDQQGFSSSRVNPDKRMSCPKQIELESYRHFKPISLDKYPALEVTDHIIAEQEALNHGSKKFHFNISSSESHLWKLPPVDEIFVNEYWEDSDLQHLKSELNSVKALLEDFDLEQWHKHTHFSNPAFKIVHAVRNEAKPELLTQAFLKFYEILNAFPLIPENIEEMHSIHLCEAPGAFIVSLNHFLSLFRPNIKWTWTGNTFNPYYEGTPSQFCIFDDRLILHTQSNWFFGKDGTGDITNKKYPDELLNFVDKKVYLVTADGSIDCQGDPGKQEESTHMLHFSEVFLALMLLAPGGSLVIKKFTFFESQSANLLYLIACVFEDVHVYKPITSKLGNSEVYVIGLNFQPSESLNECLKCMQQVYGQTTLKTSMFSSHHLPSSFKRVLRKCSAFFKQYQVDAISKNLDLFHKKSEKCLQFNELLKEKVHQLFTSLNPCSALSQERKLVLRRLEWDKNIFPRYTSLKWGGQLLKQSKLERLTFLENRFDKISEDFLKFNLKPPSDGVIVIEKNMNSSSSVFHGDFSLFKITKGKPFFYSYITRFCDANIMQLYVRYFAECITDSDAFYTQSQAAVNLHHQTEWNKMKQTCLQKSLEFANTECNRKILTDVFIPGPNGDCGVLEKLMDMMSTNSLENNVILVLVHQPLYTRLQCGLFLLLSQLFSSVKFHFYKDFSQYIPLIELSGLVSKKVASETVLNLKKSDWIDGGSRVGILDICPVNYIVESSLYVPICQYNTLFALNDVVILKNSQTKGL